MIEQFLNWDQSFFLFLNSFHNNLFDSFFSIVTQTNVWIPLYIAFIFIIIKTKKQEAAWILLGMIITIVLADQISSSLLKELVGRLRPSHEPTLSGLVHLVDGYKGGQFGFVSSHAANSFAFALFSSLVFKNRIYALIIFLWAIVNAYSRIYLGVHYPGDIIGGMIVGFIAVWFVYAFLKKYQPIIFKSNKYKPKFIKRFWNSEKLISLVVGVSFLTIFVYVFIEKII